MKCPECDGVLKTLDSRPCKDINGRYRRKGCVSCGAKSSTLEVVVKPGLICDEGLTNITIDISLRVHALAVGQIGYILAMIGRFENDNKTVNWRKHYW